MKKGMDNKDKILLVDILMQGITFNDTEIDIGLLYNDVLKQANINECDNIY